MTSSDGLAEPVNVLHLFDRMARGGAELRTLQIMTWLDPARTRLYFASLSGEPGELDEDVRRAGGAVFPLRLGVMWPLHLRRLTRRLNIDVVHAHAATSSGLFLAVAWMVGVKGRVAHFRSDGDGRRDTQLRRLHRWVMRWLITLAATDVVGVSPGALKFSGQVGRRIAPPTSVIPSGLDTTPFRAIGDVAWVRAELLEHDNQVLVLHVGRDRPEKNRPRALSILAACRARGIDAVLVMAGRTDAAEERRLIRIAQELGVLDSLRLIGERADIPELVSAADLTLVTSTREGLPGIILESVAAGTPVVSSELPGATWIGENLGMVRAISLNRSDEEWASIVSLALKGGRLDRLHAVDRVDSSIFSIQNAAAAFERLWGAYAKR